MPQGTHSGPRCAKTKAIPTCWEQNGCKKWTTPQTTKEFIFDHHIVKKWYGQVVNIITDTVGLWFSSQKTKKSKSLQGSKNYFTQHHQPSTRRFKTLACFGYGISAGLLLYFLSIDLAFLGVKRIFESFFGPPPMFLGFKMRQLLFVGKTWWILGCCIYFALCRPTMTSDLPGIDFRIRLSCLLFCVCIYIFLIYSHHVA